MLIDIKKLDDFPALPGIYMMKSQTGTILYIGKAKNLRARIKQYFIGGGDGRPQIPLLVSRVENIDTIVVTSEKEALLLENTLIKEHRPKYNALLKDDKTYVALKINHRHPWPMVQLVRYKGRPESGALYFGPYTSAFAAKTTLDLIHHLFPLRQCSDQELVRRTRPCILYDMKQCIAPCVGKCTKEEYQFYVDKAIRFLRGQDKEIVKELYAEMVRFADTLDFENAHRMQSIIKQIEKTLEGQLVDKPLGGNSDVLSIYRQAQEVILIVLFIRKGKLVGSRHFNFTNIVEEDYELLTSFIIQNYKQQVDLPEEILLPCEIEDSDLIAEIISAEKPRKTRIYMPQRGDKKALLEMAFINAETIFNKEKNIQSIREKALLEMQEVLHLQKFPNKIECFDNSNIAGKDPVAAMIVFVGGVKTKNLYRKYKVRTVSTPDDYATMYEILLRRYRKAEEEDTLPDLIIVDGGKGHLNIALKVMAELNIVSVDVIALAKEEGRHDKGLTSEQIFLPNRKDPIILRRNSPALLLLQQIRDEAHRFAITFHRQRRSKQIVSTELANLEGIGPVKQKILLKHFGSVKKLKEANRDDLEKVKGLSKRNVEVLLKFITSFSRR